MKFNAHSNLEGRHAFLSASKYHWLNYTEEKVATTYKKFLGVQRGTELHEFAATCIRMRQKLPDCSKTLNQHVNDAIGFRMDAEVTLYYSDNCFGTADAIKFDDQRRILRIHDLKTGEGATSMNQLMVYAALFCLEYDYEPNEIRIVLRIYQHDTFEEFEPSPVDIREIMNKIRSFDRVIDAIKMEDRE